MSWCARSLSSAVLAVLVVVAPSTAPALGSVPPAGAGRLGTAVRVAERDALRRAEAALGRPGDRRGHARRADATTALRDLALAAGAMRGVDRARAEALLARPTLGVTGGPAAYAAPSEVACSTNVCLHWVESTLDAPPLRDADGDGRPDWVDLNLAVLEHVWTVEIETQGYRPPRSDAGSVDHGPDGRVDVYLADVGSQGVFGYCATDDPDVLDAILPARQASGYCVLDNDFRAGQFPGASGERGLEATAPHEFFHLVQFGYDVGEDPWFMEATATWMEDEVFDGVNENRSYLPYGSLRHGDVPIDRGLSDPLAMYGNWIFIRYLSERFGDGGRSDPTIVRRAWEFADAGPGAPDDYSIQALADALAERDADLGALVGDFAAANVAPERFYQEGAAYPTPVLGRRLRLSPARTSTGWERVATDHLTSRYIELRVRGGATIRVDVAAGDTDLVATVVVVARGGGVRLTPIVPGSGASVRAARRTARVVLVLTNVDTRYDCGAGTDDACAGVPAGDGRSIAYRATLT